MSEPSRIISFFKDQTVFITGGTGFVGKLVIEKILRECWNVNKIYILIRPKKQKSPQERFDELFNLPCFHLIKHKNFKEKVSFINGDCNQALLGLSHQDITILKAETTIIIHAAANVKYSQTLRETCQSFKATRDLVALAKTMPLLKVFLYVSTAYSNCLNAHIKEDFYKPPIQAEALINLVDNLNDEMLEKITPVLLDPWPNTYIYGKCITEDLIKRASLDVPTAIVRPSIITSSVNEPIPGWIDNFYGLVGVLVIGGLGALHTILAQQDYKFSTVPVDNVSNNIIAATWFSEKKKSKNVQIYNCTGFDLDNHISLRQIIELGNKTYYKVPFDEAFWYYFLFVTSSKWWFKILAFLLHTLPSYLVDFVLFLLGKKTMAVKRCKYMNHLLELFSYFTTREWTFEQTNMSELWKEMCEDDRKIFNFSLKNFDINRYGQDMAVGMRTYLMKNPPQTIHKARKRLKVFAVVHYVFVSVVFYVFYKMFYFFYKMLFT